MMKTRLIKIKEGLQKNLLYFLYLFILVVLSEILIRKFYPQKTYSNAYKDAIHCFKKSEFAVFELKENCNFKFENYDTKETFDVHINSMGYRGEEFSLVKPKDTKRILVLGDSFIMGFGVKDNELLTNQLKNKLADNFQNNTRKTEVINAGYAGGFGPDGYYLYLKNKGIKLDPDLVIFSVFVYNDLSDLKDSDWIGTGKYGEPQKIVSRKVFVDDNGYLLPITLPFIYKMPILRESHLAVLLSDVYGAVQKKLIRLADKIKFTIYSPKFPDGSARDSSLPGRYYSGCFFGGICHRQVFHLFTDLLSTIKASRNLVDDQTSDKRTKFVVMLIPAEFQLYKDTIVKYNQYDDIPQNIYNDRDPYPQKIIKEMLEKENISYIDLLPEFRKTNERLYFMKDGHWNARANEITAGIIQNWISNQK